MAKIDKKLRAKGWSDHEINKVHSIINTKGAKHIEFGKGLNRILFMTALIVMTLCIIAVSLFLIPFLIVISNYFIYFIIAALGISFGLLFNFIIQDIEHLERKHHWFAAIYMPAISIFALTVSVHAANRVEELLGYSLRHNPWTVGAIFIIVFMMPYIISSIKKKSL
ncbi:MAG: hypothetical protein U9R08_02055 [Nanoarchaeota archaeon]|nr:hypothetical protein [Nanoarchaeota archaeon]